MSGTSEHEINDFVAIDIPVTDAVQAFQERVDAVRIATIVVESWRREAEVVEAVGLCHAMTSTNTVVANLNLATYRPDGMVVPAQWGGGPPPFPQFEGELEIVSFGSRRTHLHLRGRSDLGPPASTAIERSLTDRPVIAHVRQILTTLGLQLCDPNRSGPP